MTPVAGAAVPRLYPARRALELCVGAAILVAAYAEVLWWQFDLALPMAGATAVFAAATVSSIAGFAFSALCGPVLAQLDIGPVRMVQTMALCSIPSVWAQQSRSTRWPWLNRAEWRDTLPGQDRRRQHLASPNLRHVVRCGVGAGLHHVPHIRPLAAMSASPG